MLQRTILQRRGRRLRWLASTLVGLVAVLVMAAPSVETALAQTSSWISLFDGTPAGLLSYNPATWDVMVHSGDTSTWKQLETMNGHTEATAPARLRCTRFRAIKMPSSSATVT